MFANVKWTTTNLGDTWSAAPAAIRAEWRNPLWWYTFARLINAKSWKGNSIIPEIHKSLHTIHLPSWNKEPHEPNAASNRLPSTRCLGPASTTLPSPSRSTFAPHHLKRVPHSMGSSEIKNSIPEFEGINFIAWATRQATTSIDSFVPPNFWNA